MKSSNRSAAPTPPAKTSIDWRRVVSTACLTADWTALATAALGSTDLAALVGEAFRSIGRSIEKDIARIEAQARAVDDATETRPVSETDDAGERHEPPQAEETREEPSPTVFVDVAAVEAATILGVDVDATADEIRAALRSRLSSSRLHPDQGGDGEEAKRLIAAKNLLVARARTVRP